MATQTTPRWGYPYPQGADVPDIPAHLQALAIALDKTAQDDQGPLASRPVSTPASPGKRGRYYFADDEGVLYRDTGTGWVRIAPDAISDTTRTAMFPPGALMQTAAVVSAGSEPDGWLLCDGREVAQAAFPALYAALGSTWGTASAGKFRLPDYRGRVIVGSTLATNGAPALSGVSARNLGASGGAETHTLSQSEMPAHNHGGQTGGGTTGWNDRSLNHLHDTWASGAGFTSGVFVSGSTQSAIMQTGGVSGSNPDLNHLHSIPPLAISSQGGNGAHNNLQPYAVAHTLVKT